MAQVSLTAASVLAAIGRVETWRTKHKMSVSRTFIRELVLEIWMNAVSDPRLTEDFDPEATYTQLGVSGIELATDFLTESLTTGSNDWTTAHADTAGAARDAKALDVVTVVDMILTFVKEAHYTTVLGLAAGSYDPRWVDEDADGTEDVDQPPKLLNAPLTITDPVMGDVASISPAADWSGSPSLAYQWFQNDTAISGATSATYTPATPVVAGDTLRVRVTATNDAGSTIEFSGNDKVVAADPG